jgi:hypothetical protein
MGIFRVEKLDLFSERPEVFPGIQKAWAKGGRPCLVYGDQVGIIFDGKVEAQLNQFYEQTWDALSESRDTTSAISELYNRWIKNLPDGYAEPVPSTRAEITRMMTDYTYDNPPPGTANDDRPPPPDQPDMVRIPLDERDTKLPLTYGHLPFKTKTKAREVFYRWESWPQSPRIDQATLKIKPGTCAAPASEVQFCPTGFGAVARFALPSFFPHVFRYEIQPEDGTDIYCGASVPMFGQSGGGVEVYFVNGAVNRGPIANAVVLSTF